MFSGASAAGSMDVYLTAPNADLASVAPMASALVRAYLTSYSSLAAGTYELRVTPAGDKTTILLDAPNIVLSDQQVTTLILTDTASGVLVNGTLVDQGAGVTSFVNADALVRVAAAAANNGAVLATTTDGSFSANVQSPSVGTYVRTPAALTGLTMSVDGTPLDTSGVAVAPGSAATLMVYGDAGAAQWKALVDDNLPPASNTQTKLRLVNLVHGLAGSVTLDADYVDIADNIAYATASTAATISAGTSMLLQATSPLYASPLYSATNVSLEGQHVYTVFLLGEAGTGTPVVVPFLRKDR